MKWLPEWIDSASEIVRTMYDEVYAHRKTNDIQPTSDLNPEATVSFFYRWYCAFANQPMSPSNPKTFSTISRRFRDLR
jgi:hypothetical protein